MLLGFLIGGLAELIWGPATVLGTLAGGLLTGFDGNVDLRPMLGALFGGVVAGLGLAALAGAVVVSAFSSPAPNVATAHTVTLALVGGSAILGVVAAPVSLVGIWLLTNDDDTTETAVVRASDLPKGTSDARAMAY